MTICYFGFYNPSYSRNAVLMRGLKKNGVTVVECRTAKTGFAKYVDLYKKHRALRGRYDALFVAFPGQQAMILARFITRKPIVFDAFTSLYDSMVCDRKLVSRWSMRALYYWKLDFISCLFADRILLDTQAHIEYFAKTFKIRRKKFVRIFVGSDDAVYRPLPKKMPEGNAFIVHFHGSFIPLHGIEHIIQAAHRVEGEDILFTLVGDGQTHDAMRKMAERLQGNNIRFHAGMSHTQLNEAMNSADICLGIFGNTEKALRVIPNKIYEALGAGKAVITEESPGAKELLEDGITALFACPADAGNLAEKILQLKNDSALCRRIAAEGHRLFLDNLTPKILGKQLRTIIESIL